MIQVLYIYCALHFYYYYISSTSDHQALAPRSWGPLGLMEGRAYPSEARSWSKSPKCAADTSRTWRQSLLSGGGWRLLVNREVMSGGFFSYQGNQQRGMHLTAPLVRTITSWDLEKVCRKVSQVGKIQMKQALVRQEMYKSKRMAIFSGLTI